MQELKCLSCGAPLDYGGGISVKLKCSYCKTEYIRSDNSGELGYSYPVYISSSASTFIPPPKNEPN